MTIRYIGAILAALLLVAGATAQTTADLLQQGIHTQESAGDLDRAIAIYRQVVASPNKELASQAQYQLVLCMLQKGDRAAAAREARTLEQSFPAQKDLIAKARQLTESRDALMPEPWGERESSQLNIKKDGVFTGDYLFYSVDPDIGRGNTPADPSMAFLTWELKTRSSSRSVLFKVIRGNMQAPTTTASPYGPETWPRLEITDGIGDPAVVPLIGPAIDVQGSVFQMRRLPLAVGYKTSLTSHALAIGETAPRKLEINVTGIESVQTPSGKYNCYRVAIEPIRQTFWFSVDAGRSLVKIQSGNVEAELVKIWGPEDVLAPVKAVAAQAGWDIKAQGSAGAVWSASADKKGARYYFQVEIRKIYTPASEIPDALRRAVGEEQKTLGEAVKILPDTIQTRIIQGRQAMSCILERGPDPRRGGPEYIVWIRTESAAVKFAVSTSTGVYPALTRWESDQLLSSIRIP